MKELHLHRRDFLAVGVCLIYLAALIVLNIFLPHAI